MFFVCFLCSSDKNVPVGFELPQNGLGSRVVDLQHFCCSVDTMVLLNNEIYQLCSQLNSSKYT